MRGETRQPYETKKQHRDTQTRNARFLKRKEKDTHMHTTQKTATTRKRMHKRSRKKGKRKTRLKIKLGKMYSIRDESTTSHTPGRPNAPHRPNLSTLESQYPSSPTTHSKPDGYALSIHGQVHSMARVWQAHGSSLQANDQSIDQVTLAPFIFKA